MLHLPVFFYYKGIGKDYSPVDRLCSKSRNYLIAVRRASCAHLGVRVRWMDPERKAAHRLCVGGNPTARMVSNQEMEGHTQSPHVSVLTDTDAVAM